MEIGQAKYRASIPELKVQKFFGVKIGVVNEKGHAVGADSAWLTLFWKAHSEVNWMRYQFRGVRKMIELPSNVEHIHLASLPWTHIPERMQVF